MVSVRLYSTREVSYSVSFERSRIEATGNRAARCVHFIASAEQCTRVVKRDAMHGPRSSSSSERHSAGLCVGTQPSGSSGPIIIFPLLCWTTQPIDFCVGAVLFTVLAAACTPAHCVYATATARDCARDCLAARYVGAVLRSCGKTARHLASS